MREEKRMYEKSRSENAHEEINFAGGDPAPGPALGRFSHRPKLSKHKPRASSFGSYPVWQAPTTVWPSGLRRWLQAPVRKGVGLNPTAVILSPFDSKQPDAIGPPRDVANRKTEYMTAVGFEPSGT